MNNATSPDSSIQAFVPPSFGEVEKWLISIFFLMQRPENRGYLDQWVQHAAKAMVADGWSPHTVPQMCAANMSSSSAGSSQSTSSGIVAKAAPFKKGKSTNVKKDKAVQCDLLRAEPCDLRLDRGHSFVDVKSKRAADEQTSRAKRPRAKAQCPDPPCVQSGKRSDSHAVIDASTNHDAHREQQRWDSDNARYQYHDQYHKPWGPGP